MFGVKDILDSSGNCSEDDYYKILNCDENSTVDQINSEFKILALESHPDKNPEDQGALIRFQNLQHARDTLIDPVKRKEYDKWRRSGLAMTFKQWIALDSRCKPSMHWAKPNTQVMIEGAGDAERTGQNEEMEHGSSRNVEDSIHVASKKLSGQPESGLYRKFRNYQI